MAQFNDLRDISASHINSAQAGQKSRSFDTSNRLSELQLANAPRQLADNNRLTKLKLDQAERAPADARAKEKREILMKIGPALAKKMEGLTPDEQEKLFNQTQIGLQGFFQRNRLNSPDDPTEPVTLESVGGLEGFKGMFGGGVGERNKKGRVVAGVNEQGESVFFQADEVGSVGVLEGVTPPKSSQEFKQEQTLSKQEKGRRAAISKATTIISKVDKALDQTGSFTSGFFGTILSAVPGTEASDLTQTLNTIQANLGFEELRAMREASPTGGALGSITEKEIDKLEATLDSLKQRQSEGQLKENLTNVKRTYEKIRGMLNGSLIVPETQSDFDSLPKGSMYIDPDDGLLYRK